MAIEFKVFFSWQSDLPSNQTKRFIEDCIEVVRNDMPDSIVLIPDEATRNRLGSPDITESIYDKISTCDLFIADVSIVGFYISQKHQDDDEPEKKFVSNPNVLLELGYAAGTISWDRCICLANTKYGELKELPFDLNHRRVTAYSYDSGGRNAEIKRISDIIKSTVLEYSNKPLPKKDFSHHIVGGYNFSSGDIEQKIIPLNEISFIQYNEHTQKMKENANELILKIQNIHLLPLQDENTLESVTTDKSVDEVTKKAIIDETAVLKVYNSKPATIDREYIEENIKKHFNFVLTDDFYYVGNLKECSSILPVDDYSLEGTDLEKEKFELLQQLESIFCKIELRELYLHTYDGLVIVPLAITNCSQKNDKRIAVSIKVLEGTPVNPTSSLIIPELEGVEGIIYEYHLAKENLHLPENNKIKMDSSLMQSVIEPYIPKIQPPVLNAFGYVSTPEYDADDYEEELEEFIQETNEGSTNEYSFTIGELRPKETVWLDKVILIKPVNEKIIIEYTIKSTNTTGDLNGTLLYSAN